MMDFLGIIIRYIPFWAVPLTLISLEFGHRYWLRRKRPVYRFLLGLSFFSITMTIFYIWAGGPEKSAKLFFKFLREF